MPLTLPRASRAWTNAATDTSCAGASKHEQEIKIASPASSARLQTAHTALPPWPSFPSQLILAAPLFARVLSDHKEEALRVAPDQLGLDGGP
eukprot:365515-Chlamydomonas_euryale.AAC.3